MRLSLLPTFLVHLNRANSLITDKTTALYGLGKDYICAKKYLQITEKEKWGRDASSQEIRKTKQKKKLVQGGGHRKELVGVETFRIKLSLYCTVKGCCSNHRYYEKTFMQLQRL
jgi:hypothetical protein